MAHFIGSSRLTGSIPEAGFAAPEGGRVLEPADGFAGSEGDGEGDGEGCGDGDGVGDGGDEGGEDLEEGKLELFDSGGKNSLNGKLLCVIYQLAFIF